MKLSADPNHPWYDIDVVYRAEVYLNGERLLNVITADSDCGWVEVYKINKDGSYALRNGDYVTERRCGNVCILIPEDE